MSNKKNLISAMKRSTIEAFLLRGSAVSLLFGMQIVLGRLLGTDGYGGFSYVLAVANLLVVITVLGLPNGTMRFVAEYTEKKRWSHLKGIIIISIPIVLGMSLVFSVILLILVKLSIFHSHINESFYLVALILPLIALGQLRGKVIRGFHRIRESLFPEEVLLPFIFIIALYIFSVKTTKESIYLYFICYLLVLALGFYWLVKIIPAKLKKIKAEYNIKEWLMVSFPMTLGSLMQLVLNKTDIIMIGMIVGLDSTGLYSAANRIALINTFILRVVDTSVAPLISTAYHSNDNESLKNIIKMGTKWSIFGTIPFFAIIMIWPELILGLFGDSFKDGKIVLRILAIGQFVNAITGPVGFALLMTGNQKIFAIIMFISAIINLIGNAYVIPYYGAMGAALVTTSSIIILNLGMFVATKKMVF
jgi:O-antigen/teichoic acid export membrane protein